MCWVSHSRTRGISDLGSAAEYGLFRKEPGRDLKMSYFHPQNARGAKYRTQVMDLENAKAIIKNCLKGAAEISSWARREHLAAQAKQLSAELELSDRDYSIRGAGGHSLALVGTKERLI